MSMSPASRGWTTIEIPTKTTTAYVQGGFVYNDGTDNVPVTTGTQGNIIGIMKEDKDVATTGTASMSVLIPTSIACTFKSLVTGTLTKAMEGDQFDFASDVAIAQGTSTYDAVTLVKFIDATHGVFKLNYTFGVEN